MTDCNLNEYEKIRLRLKIMWEGGLSGYIDYGIASCLRSKFKEEFDEILLLQEKSKIKSNKKIKELTKKIETFLDGNIKSMNMNSINMKNYKEVNLNDYNYILET